MDPETAKTLVSAALVASITLFSGGFAQTVSDDFGHVHVAFRAVEAMAQVMAVALAPVRCNVIRPGFVDSALWDYLDEDERADLRETERARTLTGEVVSLEALGHAVVDLMATGSITGAVIPVDGGRHVRTEP